MTDTPDAPIALSSTVAELITAHCARTGLSRAQAVEDLLRRGAQQVDLVHVRDAVDDIRATTLDTLHALDALAPYGIAALGLLAHWAARTGTTKLREEEYAEAARDNGRATWDGHLIARAIPLPMRPLSDQPSDSADDE
jgi:hypothetical protein